MSDIVRILDQSKETQDVESLPPAPAEIRQVDEQNSDAITELFKTQGKTPADMEAMALASGNEKEFYSKVASSLYYSKALNLNVGFVWDHFDQVQKNYRGRAMPAESDWKAIGNEYESGWLSIDMGKEYNTLMSLRDQLKDAENFKKWNIASQGGIAGSADQTFNQDVWSSPGNVGQYTPQERNPEYLQARLLETQAKIDELKKRRDVIPVDLTDRGLVISAAKAASQFMPSIMDTLPSAVLAGVLTGGGSLIAQGGMAGVRALGLKAGAKAVMQAGAGAAEATGFAKGYQLEGGLAYGDMVEAGVPHEIASQYSQMIGVINGSLEMAQIGTLGGLASPATKGLIEWAVKQGTERAVNKGLLAAGAIRFASRWAAGTIESTGQEVAQEVSSIIFEEAAKALANSKYAADIPMKTWDETLNQLKDVAIGAFLGSAVIGLPGSVVGHMTEGHPKAVKEKAQAVAKELEGVDPRIVAAQIAKTIQEPEVDQVQAFMDKQETEPTVLQEDGSPIVYYTAGASLEGIKLFRNPEDAALEADKTTRIPSPETVLEAIKTKYGPEVAREAEQGQGEAASILQAAKDKAPAWSEFHKVDITAEPAKMAMVYADVKDLAQVRMDEDGNVTLQGAGAVVPAGTIQAGELIAPQGAKIEAKAGKITLEAGGQVSEAHYRDTAEGRVIDQLPENPAHARAILKQNAGAKVNVTQDQLAQVLDTRERRSLEKQMDRLSEAESQARAEYNQAEDKEAARPALEAALADIEAQRSSIIDQMMTHDRELVGDEALRPTQATEDEYRADLTQKMRDAAPEGITNEMIAAYADLMTVRANAMGFTLAEWGRRYLGADPFRDGTAAGNRGSVTFDDGKAVITFAEKSDPTTFVHEFGHIIRRQLADEDQAALLKHYGKDGWTRETEEAFAHDFEAVFLEGDHAPKGLEAIFRKIVYWFRQVYRGIRGHVSSEVRAIIDRAFVADCKRAGMSQAEAEAELYQPAGDTNSPEFKAWFGDSVVTEDGKPGGKPLVVYHGTYNKFDAFSKDKINTNYGNGAKGFHFAEDWQMAMDYAEELAPPGFKPRVIAVYLSEPDASKRHLQQANGKTGYAWVVDTPTQIKSIDNTGTWNSEDPRILYQPEKPTQFETNRLAKEIELASKGILPSGAEITFGNTPIVLQKSGLQSRALVMKQSKLLSGMKPASESHGHNLTSQDYLNAQSGIWNPVFVLQSDTVPGAFVVVTEEKDLSNDYLIASINPDDNRHKPANVITSVYGKSNLSNMIERAFDSGMVIYRNTEKETALLQTIGLQLSKVAYWAAKNKYITQDDVFKSKDELFQPTIYAERNRQLLDQIAHYEAEHMAGKDRSAELAELRGRLADNREAWRDDLHRALDHGEAIDAGELAEFPDDPRLDQAAFDYFMAADTFGDAQAAALETVAQGRTRDQILDDFRKELPERLQRIKEISGAAYFGRFGQHDRRTAAYNLGKAQFTKTGKLRDSKWYRDRQKDYDQKWGDDDAIMEEEQARGGWKVPNRIRFDLDLGEAVKVYLESKDGTDEKGRDLLTRAIQTIEKNLEHYAWNMAYASGDFDLMAELWAADQADPEGAAALENAAEEKKTKRQEAKDLGRANAIERIEALKDRLAGRSLRKMTDDELTALDRDIKSELKKLDAQIREKDQEIKYLDSKYSDAASAGLKYLEQVKDLKAQIAKGDKQAAKLLAKIKKEHQAGLEAAKAAREAGQAKVEAGKTELHDVTKSAREEARMNATAIKTDAEAKKAQALAELRELYAIKEKKLSFARLIMKKPGRNVDATYAVHILDIQEFFSGVRNLQRAKTIQRKIKLFSEAQPQTFATLPIEIQEIVLNTRVEAWTVDQLEALHMQLEALKSKGKQVYAERVEAEKQAVAGIVYRLRKSLLTQDAGAEARGPKIREESNKAREFLLSITDPQMAFDTLDGGAGYRGAFMTEIHDAMAEKKAAAYEKILERKAQAKEQMKALGIKDSQRFDWLMVEDKPVIITQGGHAYRMTMEEATGIYILAQNEKSLKAILEGNRIPEAVIDQVKAYLPKEWKALGDWIIEHGYGDHTDRLADVYYRLNNEYMGREERYSPMVRRDISGSQLAEDMKDEIARRNMQKKTPQKGFTQGRIEIGKRFQSAIRIDALTLYNEMVDKQEIFMNLAPVIRRFNSVFGKGSPELKTAIANTHGSEYVKYINEWIARTANTSTPRSATERFIMQARGNLSAAMLGYQVGSAIKQVSGLALTMGEMRNPFRYLASIPGTLATFRASYAEMIKQSPELAHRTIDPSVFTANSSHSKLGFMAMKFRDSGFAMQQWMDTLTVTTGWTAMYQENLSQGMDEKTAARQATNAINRTQPTSDAMENSPIMADKGAIAVFTGFGSATSKIWNNLAHLPDFRRASEVTRYMLRVGSIALSALAFATIGNLGWPDDEDEDKKGKFWKGVMMDASFGNLPILGSPLKAAASGYESRYPLLGGIFEAIKKLSGIDGDMTDQQMYSTMDSVFEAGSLLTGAPYLQLKRLFTGLTQDENTVEKAMKMIIFGRA